MSTAPLLNLLSNSCVFPVFEGKEFAVMNIDNLSEPHDLVNFKEAVLERSVPPYNLRIPRLLSSSNILYRT